MTAPYTFVGNIRINTPQRLRRLELWANHARNSGCSEVCLKIRGKCKSEAATLLMRTFAEKFRQFDDESDSNWTESVKALVATVKTEIVIQVIEDHLLVCNSEILGAVAEEMLREQIDIVHYSWFSLEKTTSLLDGIPSSDSNYLRSFVLDGNARNTWLKNYRQKKNRIEGPHAVSLAAMFRKSFYEKVLNSYDLSAARFSQQEPFDFEKNLADLHALPYRLAESKIELFACIDDDNLFPGSSLQKRGIYLEENRWKELATGGHDWRYRDINILLRGYTNDSGDELPPLVVRKYKDDERYAASEENAFLQAGLLIEGLAKGREHLRGVSAVEIFGLTDPVSESLLVAFFSTANILFHDGRLSNCIKFIEKAILNGWSDRVYATLFSQTADFVQMTPGDARTLYVCQYDYSIHLVTKYFSDFDNSKMAARENLLLLINNSAGVRWIEEVTKPIRLEKLWQFNRSTPGDCSTFDVCLYQILI